VHFAVRLLVDDFENGALFSVATIAIPLSFFIIGVFVAGQMVNYFDVAPKRGWLVLSNVVATNLGFVAAAIQWHFVHIVGQKQLSGGSS
jgi:hypothetical protein